MEGEAAEGQVVRAASSLPVEVVLLRVAAARLPAGAEAPPLPVEGVVRQVELAAPAVREGQAVPEVAAVPGVLVETWSVIIRADSRCLSLMDLIQTAHPRAHCRGL